MNRLRVGDQVMVISGKNKGQIGRLKTIFLDRDVVIIEGINIVTRNEKPTQRNEKGKQVKKEAPVRACKVMPVDPTTGKATRVRIELVDGKKVRKAKSGAIIAAEA